MSNTTKSPAMAGQQELPAGRFSSWLHSTRSAQVNEGGVEVPCGECNACCRSSYFIHVRPEETQTLARIPVDILFAAPGLPKGNVILGYDQDGHCPMLVDGKCSIYDHRPLTCRTYDCRIFPAAGITAGDDGKAAITQQIKRWKFSCPTKLDLSMHSAVQAAAKFLREREECFPAGVVPGNLTQLAVLAIKVYDVFLKYNDEAGKTGLVSPYRQVAKAVMEAIEKFEVRCDMVKVHPT